MSLYPFVRHSYSMDDYPPEPWYLGGRLLVSAFLVPRASIPRAVTQIPEKRTPLRWGDRLVVGVAFARYVPGGVLSYDELLVALPSVGGTPAVTIPQIWVDSPESVAGGRALWSIPKHLGAFDHAETESGTSSTASAEGGMIASVSARYGRTLLPGMHQLPLPTLQRLEGRTVLSTNRVIGRVRALRAHWEFTPHGPLGYLHGRTPFGSFAVTDASIIFGLKVRRAR
jgi:hypothetical protein